MYDIQYDFNFNYIYNALTQHKVKPEKVTVFPVYYLDSLFPDKNFLYVYNDFLGGIIYYGEQNDLKEIEGMALIEVTLKKLFYERYNKNANVSQLQALLATNILISFC